MSAYPPPPRRGVAWFAFVACVAAAAIGFMLGRVETARYWAMDALGAPAAIGAAAAIFAVIASQAARALHRRGASR